MPEHLPTSHSEHPSTVDQQREHFLTVELHAQYLAEVTALRSCNLLEPIMLAENDDSVLELGEGITAMDGVQHALPSVEAIQKHFSAEKYKEKIEQGFTRLLVVPFGYPLETLKIRYQELLLKKHKQGKLLDRDGKPLELDTNEPLYFFNEFNHSDETREMIYYPTAFDKNNHGGTTKAELLQDKSQPFHGFHILLIKPDLTIPREGKAKIIGTRKDLEAGQSSADYLKTIRTQPQYRQEQGMTLEDELTLAITELETNNTVINDWENGKDSLNLTIANFYNASDYVPNFFWYRTNRRALVVGYDPGDADEDYGARVAVG